jgi:hypothetical protein
MARFNAKSNLEVVADAPSQQVFGRDVRYTRALAGSKSMFSGVRLPASEYLVVLALFFYPFPPRDLFVESAAFRHFMVYKAEIPTS